MSVSADNGSEFSFERGARLAEDDAESDGLVVHGVAIGEGDVTVGASGIKKLWPSSTLEPAAESLQGRPIVVDHDNSSYSVVGEVTKSGYKLGVGVIYEAEVHDEELEEKIENGLLEVSIRGYHRDPAEMSEAENGAKIVDVTRFDNLSIVPVGASDSNSLEAGEHAELEEGSIAEMLEETSPTEDNNMTDNQTEESAEADVDVEELQARIDGLEAENESLESEAEELREEVHGIRMEYAEALAEEGPFEAEELADRFEFAELQDKFDEADFELASTPAPQSVDTEEELETGSPDEETEARIEELNEQIEAYDAHGWDAARRDAEAELAELRDDE